LGLELLVNRNENFRYGVGLVYLLPRTQTLYGSRDFRFIPVYAIFDVNTPRSINFIPSLIITIGYNIKFSKKDLNNVMANLSGGPFWGFGLRYALENFFIEGSYKSFNGNSNVKGKVVEISYTTISFGFGYHIEI